TITARVALEKRTIHVADLQTDDEYGYTLRDIDPVHTELGVPMFRGDEILGVIILYKFEVQPFTEADRPHRNVRRPSCHCDGERAGVQRDEGGARPTNGHC